MQIKNPGKYQLDYVFLNKIEENTYLNRTTTKNITRHTTINCLGITNDLFRFHVLCNRIEIKGYYGLDNRLLIEIIRLFDNLILDVNMYGSIVKVLNVNQILARWLSLKESFDGRYVGEDFENYIQKLDVLINDENALIRFLMKAKMLGLFFNLKWNKPLNDLLCKDEFLSLKNKDADKIEFEVRDNIHNSTAKFEFRNNQLTLANLTYTQENTNFNYYAICLG